MIVVFGGTGMLGQHTAKELIDKGETVVVTGVRRQEPVLLKEAVAREQAIVEHLDLGDPFAVMAVVAKYKPDVVVDTSGYAPKQLAAAAEVRARVSAELNLLEASKLNGVKRIVLTSSSDAYWGLGQEYMPLKEDMPAPLQEDDDNFIVQSWAKKVLEVIANLYRRQEGLNIVTVRCSGMYGPIYRTFLNLPSRLIKAGLENKAPDFSKGSGVPLESDGYDTAYVKDIAQGMGLVIRAPALKHHIYNLGSGRAVSYGEIARAVEKAIPGFKVQLRSAAPASSASSREVDMGNFYMDISRIRDELGYEPRYSTERAIADYADWLRTHEM